MKIKKQELIDKSYDSINCSQSSDQHQSCTNTVENSEEDDPISLVDKEMKNYYNKNFSSSEVLNTSFKYQTQRTWEAHFDTTYD